ncbi:hypothetical protein, partial [Pseudomonas aeruginosa]
AQWSQAGANVIPLNIPLLLKEGMANPASFGLAQLGGQLGVERAAELAGERLQGTTEGSRGQAQVGQQQDHDVARAGLLQGLRALHQ